MEAKAELDLVAAAARLRVPWHTAHRWVLTGRLEGRRRKGRWFVTKASVEHLILHEQPRDLESGR